MPLIRQIQKEMSEDDFSIEELEDVEIRMGLRTERSTPHPRFKLKEKGSLSGSDLADADFSSNLPTVVTVVRSEPKVGRNDPCPCGSGKKFKKCCLN